MAERHRRLWEWGDALAPGIKPAARVEVWPRGGAKSTTGELICARLCAKLSRRFVLYVSGTQEKQADPHVQNISAWLQRLNVERAVDKYGNSRGYRASLLRTANGFNVAALGLDAAGRGVKLDQYRPDLIIFDDIDSQEDTPATVEKKIRIITTAILPTGSADCAVLFLQNKIHDDGIVSQLVDNRADFLRNRDVATVEPAVYGLKTALVDRGDGQQVYQIVGGSASWEGQNLQTCEAQLNEWGESAFLREAQHEVGNADGIFFKVSELKVCKPDEVPELVGVCLAWDFGATEGGGDYTVGFLLGKAKNGTYYVLAVIRGQWSSDRAEEVVNLACDYYLPKYPTGIRTLHLPQDPGAAGKKVAKQDANKFSKWKPVIESVTGSKAVRAKGQQTELNKGNYFLVQQDLPEIFRPYVESCSWLAWHNALREEYRKFREDESHKTDDIVDPGSDAFNVLALPKKKIRAA